MTPALGWLALSAVCFALEAFGIPGIGFLFVALGALLSAAAISLDLVDAGALVTQGAIFAVTSGISAVLLWRRLKQWRIGGGGDEYSNIIGTEATVVGALSDGMEGQVRWSGTLMRARLEGGPSAADGARVRVERVEGNLLFVRAI